ncbi:MULTISPECIES: hypothetical protein [Vibrio]|uniref:Uncharacterized protein n=1 Tax=Vibrio qingdaonensis TaxID=2829491 RepID=A0A9X3CJX3_9VIBR|nr:hypothetical protein [Vibrio qingdaonensis]MCW8344803.1 hypothetical protein [Vibrio qingdaonensis]
MAIPKQTQPVQRDKASLNISLPISEDIGLGDSIQKLTSKMGFKSCSSCSRRAARLNNLIQFKTNRNG